MSIDVLTLPERAGSRSEAQDLLRELSRDLSGAVVRLDGSHLGAGSSSYMDELVKEVLEVRRAAKLILEDVTERAAGFATSSAARRHVSDRLQLTTRS
jgi:hypothetical protein